ncbi:DCC1-like thiol-disulfide oxidoreductase family protein [Chryseobacterium gleum]|uniref:DCC1-like thiol-disulfide oxidoreductase family protein n=1 Tax=Chryseobacterium gleum TaxID=250 RepID=UPI0028AB5705|nr:DCC1-like thiol-disulfide oxidoreductase family protein [Chryseobacterium gleum]
MKSLIIFYDNWCPHCTRFTKFIKKFDWLNLIDTKQLRVIDDLKEHYDLNKSLAMKQMASYDERWYYGYDSLYNIFLRIPIFWIFFPGFFLLKISRIGQALYVQLALKRKIIPIHCSEESCDLY